ncbi:MAG: type VI secretion system lysozyme [Phycisphaerae bacterium SM23_30]|nr:MAG: type VI secretion system lysozyme [Phycisphaerae bacterium SM23_30]
MNDTSMFKRLQPCLLDRLTDDKPEAQQESREQRVISMRRYRNGVLRDLEWLLNSGSYTLVEDLDEFAEVVKSVLNYGVPDLCGLTFSGISIPELERALLEAIQFFEPRILPQSLSVHVMADSQAAVGNAVDFEIKGELWAEPMPDQIFVRTEIDLETGHWELEDRPDG